MFTGERGRAIKELAIQGAHGALEREGVVRPSEKIDPENARFPGLRIVSFRIEQAIEDAGLANNSFMMVLLRGGQRLGNCYVREDFSAPYRMQLSIGEVIPGFVVLPLPVKAYKGFGAYMRTNLLRESDQRVFGSPRHIPEQIRLGEGINGEDTRGLLVVTTRPNGSTFIAGVELNLAERQDSSARREVKSYPLIGFDYSGGGWRAVQEGMIRAKRILEENSRPQVADRFAAPVRKERHSQIPDAAPTPTPPAPDSKEAKLLRLLKADSKEAFKMIRNETETFPELITKRNMVQTRLAKFGAASTPVKIQLPEDKLTIVLCGLNTEEFIRQSSTGELCFSQLDKCLGKSGSDESLLLEIEGSEGGNYGIQARVVRMDVSTLEYTDAIPYLRSQVEVQHKVNSKFSERILRLHLENRLGTPEALAYVFDQLKADEKSGGIKKADMGDVKKIYGDRPDLLGSREPRIIIRRTHVSSNWWY